MKSKFIALFAFSIAASCALPFSAIAADRQIQTGSNNSLPTNSVAPASSSVNNDDISLFQQLDKNKDGLVDSTEIKKSAQAQGDFKAMDANGDGRVSLEEWAAFHNKTK